MDKARESYLRITLSNARGALEYGNRDCDIERALEHINEAFRVICGGELRYSQATPSNEADMKRGTDETMAIVRAGIR